MRARTGSRVTAGLLVALLLLVAVAAGESWYLWLQDDPAPTATRPVVIGELTQRAVVDAASAATEQILSTSYSDYDQQVEEATALMTPGYAEEYRRTTDRIRADFVANRIRLAVRVVGAGVVRASSGQVEALLFLDKYVRKQGRTGPVTPYRAVVTVDHTGHGWLVSDIQTR
jgi:Mce-associated membrane protein